MINEKRAVKLKGKNVLSINKSNLTFSSSTSTFSVMINALKGGHHPFKSQVKEIALTLDDGGSGMLLTAVTAAAARSKRQGCEELLQGCLGPRCSHPAIDMLHIIPELLCAVKIRTLAAGEEEEAKGRG